MTTIVVLLLIGLVLFGFAVYAAFNRASYEPSMPKRVWLAITGAIAAVGSAIAILYGQG